MPNGKENNMLNIKITSQRDALLRGFDNEFHALVQVKADENIAENKKENTLNLAIVIDCSGSMQGKPSGGKTLCNDDG